MEIKDENIPPLKITAIDDTNLFAFEDMIPGELQESIGDDIFAIGAISDETPCGAFVFSKNEDGPLIWLDSLYVAPDYRRRQIGTALFRALVEFLETEEAFASFGIAADFIDDGSGTMEFLISQNFHIEETGDKSIAVSLSRLPGCPFMQRAVSLPSGVSCMSLSELSSYFFKALNVELERVGVNYLGAPVSGETVLPECSFAAFEGEAPVCCVCFSKGSSEHELYLSLFYTRPDSVQIPLAVLGLAGNAVLKAYPPDTLVKIPVLEPSSERLAGKLLEGAGQVCDPIYEAVLDFDRLEIEEEA